MSKMGKNGYEHTYDVMAPELLRCDFQKVAPQVGLAVDPDGTVHVDFLLRHYIIDHDGVHDAGGIGHGDVNRRTVLIYYMITGGHENPLGEYHLLHNFSSGVFSGNNSDVDWMTSPLTRTYGGRQELFEQAMEILGAHSIPAKAAADGTWAYQLLPKMPVEIYYYCEDDEFPCKVEIKFDKTALSFVPFETLAVLNGCLIKEIHAIGEERVQ
jgi:hypothetical protein